ncbi:Phr family secreted Rap phosphatase inhibitor [Bacillus swezeyi]|uniref:Phr family secreted Rap phosphatase inhibitor n=1 Tax=Bacillus swezeyi TaxID=1925020 RepID=A0A5M8RIP0_9BACI|nr:Phr family secreted Rap phosphatase inhibitor [Bacillus swezeyi]KAA6447290.1 Phr family secreted Rap phosphatase inhibitor [Bacillus swezeyi]KAA6472980.1 Phr family secreted Rap phosphatase inhibitor [Bacillus swezeyi]MEC1258990.1 Phr family secreted Rap phosphatase inhibitor [Bacillus swezeyi]MED1738031.1 Phr family secreted Rap phosphatase inhibitor [Bacillus swezeyi]MED2928049.1 Phr family secreted Rap phosphatase inhibitor [Bacillus swezeyi]
MKKMLLGLAIAGVVVTGVLNFAPQGDAEFAAGEFKTTENCWFG